MSNTFQFILPLEERTFVHLIHNVACEDFLIFVNYEKNNLEIKLNSLCET